MYESIEEIETGVSSEPRVGYLKTYPIEFGGKRWWLTEEEMEHLKLIQHYLPETWEHEVYRLMSTWDLGHPKKDLNLQVKIKQAVRQTS